MKRTLGSIFFSRCPSRSVWRVTSFWAKAGTFKPVQEASRDPSSPIKDRLHGAEARDTIDSSIAGRSAFPILQTIAFFTPRRFACRTSAADLQLRSKQCARRCPPGEFSWHRVPRFTTSHLTWNLLLWHGKAPNML
jgi:hypothetical protein